MSGMKVDVQAAKRRAMALVMARLGFESRMI